MGSRRRKLLAASPQVGQAGLSIHPPTNRARSFWLTIDPCPNHHRPSWAPRSPGWSRPMRPRLLRPTVHGEPGPRLHAISSSSSSHRRRGAPPPPSGLTNPPPRRTHLLARRRLEAPPRPLHVRVTSSTRAASGCGCETGGVRSLVAASALSAAASCSARAGLRLVRGVVLFSKRE